MKANNLILVRHGKSSWEYQLPDIDRPLKKRGVNDATIIASHLKKKAFNISKVFSSPANRAFSTCKIFASILEWNQDEIEIYDELYDFSGERLIKFIENINSNYNTVVIFGHNHAFTSIANLYGDRYIENVPTAGLVKISFSTNDWKHCKYGKTELIMFPRDFK